MYPSTATRQARPHVFTRLLPGLAVIVASALFVLPPLVAYAHQPYDHGWHVDFARQWLETGRWPQRLPHVLLHLSLMGLARLLPGIDLHTINIGLMVAVSAASAYLIYRFLLTAFASPGPRQRWLAAGTALALMMIGPINFLSLPQETLYFGYLVPHTFHNPTILLQKPFAIAQFWIALMALTRARTPAWLPPAALVISLLSPIAKPNFAIAFLPALVVVALIFWRQRRPVDWRLLIAGLIAPTVVILGGQYLLMTQARGGIAFQWFGWVGFYETSVVSIVVKFGLSVLFPALMIIFIRRRNIPVPLLLAGATFVVAALQLYLVVETTDPRAGNFSWGVQPSLLLLFVVTAYLLLSGLPQARWQRRITWMALGLHVVGGLIWWYTSGLAILMGLAEAYQWW